MHWFGRGQPDYLIMITILIMELIIMMIIINLEFKLYHIYINTDADDKCR